VPQIGACAKDGGGARLRLTQVVAKVRLDDAEVHTTLAVTVENLTDSQEAFELLVPVPVGTNPDGCTGLETAFAPGAAGPATIQDVLATGGMPPADAHEIKPVQRLSAQASLEALTQLGITAHTPWPLEFAAHDLLHTPGFEIGPKGQVTVHVSYTEPLTWVAGQAIYTLPRSESHDALKVPWGLDVRIHSSPDFELATAYSPTQAITSQRQGAHDLRVKFVEGRHPEPGPITLAVLRAKGPLAAGLLVQPTTASGSLPALTPGAPPARGTFLLHTGFGTLETVAPTPREITIVLDCSGSMSKGKLDQAREAALGILGDLNPAETFNVISYETSPHPLFPSAQPADPVHLEKARDYLYTLAPRGSTDIDAALRFALLQPAPPEGQLPLVLFLTDGLPTVGEKSERIIGMNAQRINASKRRIFTFGVGNDVNAPLLDYLAASSLGTSHFVRPGENIEERIGEVFQGLQSPVMTSLSLEVLDADGQPAPSAVRYLQPARLPDLYDADRLVITGQYVTERPVTLRISGKLDGKPHHVDIPFDPRATQPGNHDYVPTLWAGRQLAVMVNSIRQAGALPAGTERDLASEDARIDAILALTKRFGVLDEYTGFLALESTNLFDRTQERTRLRTMLSDRAQLVRVGRAAISQSLNSRAALTQVTLNRLNRFVDGSMNEIQIASVRQLAGRAFFLRGATWIDSSLCLAGAPVVIDEHIQAGDARYLELLAALTSSGRPGLLSLTGNILLRMDDRVLFIEAPH
jgi:Ca-activated chloride channel family protein